MKRASILNLAGANSIPSTMTEEKDEGTKGKKQAKLSSFFAVSKAKKEEAVAASVITADTTISLSDSKQITELKSISYDFENIQKKFDGEGRTITLEFANFFLVACYVPNSGQ